MSLNYERKNSMKWVREFLRDLLDPKKTPRVPRAIRKRAYSALRHYPTDMNIEELSKKCPAILGEDWEKSK